MGDQIRDAVDGTLFYVPLSEFERVRTLEASAEERTALFATLARINALYMIARAGSGHIGSSFSSLDIVSWLHLNVLEGDTDIYFSSKGHDAPGLYSVLIGLGRLPFAKLHALRRLDGLPGHPDVGTPGIAANTGSLGMGVSKAKGMVQAGRRQGRQGRVFVLTGDGELQEGQFWESLVSAANKRMHEITVIVDHNKLQSDTHVRRVSDLGDLEAKFRAYGWHVARCDGHDMAALGRHLAAFEAVTDRPKVLIADTVKGRGVTLMEHTAMPSGEEFYKFHSGAPSPADHRAGMQELIDRANAMLKALGVAAGLTLETVEVAPAAPAGDRQRMIPAYGKALIAAADRHSNLVSLDADLILDTGLIPFRDRFPDRFVECGIAEQDMVSQASGMALKGLLPVVHSFACFLSTRPNEQIFNACTEGRRIVYVGSLAGLLPGGPGHSHQSVRDIACLGAMPGLVLVEPCHEAEVPMAVDWCVDHAPGSSYLRLVSIPCEVPYALPADYRFEPGRGGTLVEGEDAVMIGYGPVMLPQAVLAADRLRRQGIGLKVVNLPWLNRVDPSWLRETIGGAKWLFTIDNHFLSGGQGEMLCAAVAELNLDRAPKVRRFGLDRLPVCGTNPEVLRHHGLDAESLAEAIRAAMTRAAAA